MKAYWYSILQYVPDSMRREAVNVGLVVFDPFTGRWARRVAPTVAASIARLAPGPASARAAAVISSAWARFDEMSARRGGRVEFAEMAGRLAHEAQFTALAPLSDAIGDLTAATEWVAERVLPRPPVRQQRTPSVSQKFGNLLKEHGLADFVKPATHRITLYGGEAVDEKFDGEFVNGRLHLARVLPTDFVHKHTRQHVAYVRDVVEAIVQGRGDRIDADSTVHLLTDAEPGSEAQRLLRAAIADFEDRAKTYDRDGWRGFADFASEASHQH